MHTPVSYFKVIFSPKLGKSKIEGRKKTRGKTDRRSLFPLVDYSGEQWSAKPVSSGSPICQHTSNDVSGKLLTKLFEKKGETFREFVQKLFERAQSC